MKIKQLLLSTLMLYSISSLFAQHQLVLQPNATDGKDALVSAKQDQVNSNFGSVPSIHPYAWTNSGDLNIQRTFIEFDWSNLPSNAQVDSAFLYFYYSPYGVPDHSGDNDLWIRRVTGSWGENTVTWNNQPGADTTKQVYVPKSTSTSQDYKIPVTELVKHIINSGNNYGFRISLVDESIFKRVMIASSDHADSTKHPKLVLHYTGWGLSTDNIISKTQVNLYPNPTNGVFNLESSFNIESVTIVNMLGQEVYSETINENYCKINLHAESNGIYFVMIKTEMGVVTKKLVLEN
jgi:hypothetical protein